MTKEFDFYSGYEGEPELLILQKSGDKSVKTIVKLWVGFFDSIMESIEPNFNGEWEGLTYYYHTQTGWYNNVIWKCEEGELIIQQLESVKKTQLDINSQNILKVLIEVFKDSVFSNDDIYFKYE